MYKNESYGFGGESHESWDVPFQLNPVETTYIESLKADDDWGFVNLEKFRTVQNYTHEEIDQDIEAVEKHKEIFRKQEKKPELAILAHAAERLIADRIEMSNWFGQDVLMVPSSEYDDIFNGFDAFVEFQDDLSRLGLALDFTVKKAAENKVARVKREILANEIPEAKYFDSKNFIGPLKQVARLSIELDITVIDDLMRKQNQIKAYKKTNNREAIAQLRHEMDVHPLQIDILDQMILQLQTFQVFALKHDKPEFVELYGIIKEKILAIRDSREEILTDPACIAQKTKLPIGGLSRMGMLLSEF